jgi:hypothetical protein
MGKARKGKGVHERRLKQSLKGIPESTHGVNGASVLRDGATGKYAVKTKNTASVRCQLCRGSMKSKETIPCKITSLYTYMEKSPKKDDETACARCFKIKKALKEKNQAAFKKLENAGEVRVVELDPTSHVLVS